MTCSPSAIDIAAGLAGSGTLQDPWILTEAELQARVRCLSWTRKILYFRSGIFFCPEPININFGELFLLPEHIQMLREGVCWRGEARGSVIQFGRHVNLGRPLFRVWWSRPVGTAKEFQVPLFFWEFTGLNFKGECNHTLVEFGGADIEETPWNSCEFRLAANNGYREGDENVTGPARGIVIRRALESMINLVATCAKGIAAVLDCCEFCTLRGSYSNAEEQWPAAPSGHRIISAGIGLYMNDCCSNTGLTVNFEVAFTGLRLVGSCRGNVFSSIISNNCDLRGTVINDSDCGHVDESANNLIQCLVRREVRQGGNVCQEIGANPSKVAIVIAKK